MVWVAMIANSFLASMLLVLPVSTVQADGLRLEPALAVNLLPGMQAQDQDPEAVMQEVLTGGPPGAELPPEEWTVYDPFPSGIPLDWLGPVADNLRFTIDLSGRFEWNSQRREWGITQFYGFDLYKVFSGKEGDWGILLLQGFATRLQWFDRLSHARMDGPPWLTRLTSAALAAENALGNGLFINLLLEPR